MTERTLRPTNIQPAFEPGSMLVLTARVRWLFDFQTRMRADWRRDVLMIRVIRQKKGIDTFYTLRTSSGSGNAVLADRKLTRVASRGRVVQISGQNPFRG